MLLIGSRLVRVSEHWRKGLGRMKEMKMDDQKNRYNRRSRWVFIGFALVAGFFLFTEHRAHLLGALPYLLLLACPLMHLFMHHAHGKHHHEPSGSQDFRDRKPLDHGEKS